MNPIRVALALGLLLMPLASVGAAAGDDSGATPAAPLTFAVADFREGDVLRYERTDGPAGPGARTLRHAWVMNVESVGTAVDRFGATHPAAALRIDTYRGDELRAAERCHVLGGGDESVRRTPLYDASRGEDGKAGADFGEGTHVSLLRQELTPNVTLKARFEPTPCWWLGRLGGLLVTENTTLARRVLEPTAPSEEAAALSAPAQAATFAGRPALLYRFELPVEGRVDAVIEIDYVVAEGFPGVAMRTSRLREIGAVPQTDVRVSLVGFDTTGGRPMLPGTAARLPTSNTAARMVAFDPRAVDDAAYAPTLRFRDAVAAARGDPTLGFDAWLTARPKAMLVGATYDEGMRNPAAPNAPTEGGWIATFSDGETAFSFRAVRHAGATGPLSGAPVIAVSRESRVADDVVARGAASTREAPRIADSATAAQIAGAEGVARVGSFSYALLRNADGALRPHVWIADVSPANGQSEGAPPGTAVWVSLVDASTVEVYTTAPRASYRALVVQRATGGASDETRAARPLDPIASPATRVQPSGDASALAIAAGAATGVTFVAILVKFVLWPLYTRLKRDRLLDNDVRARLYERIRAEPGIHRAELADFAGVGRGATHHHLDLLVKHRYLVEVHEGGYARYFAAGEVPPALARREAILRAGSARAVYDLFASEPHVSLRDAAARLGMSAPSVHKAKKRLENAGLLPVAQATASAHVAEA